nr:bile salt-activated lipase-like [Aegilops tauschii subsp. strangulata]
MAPNMKKSGPSAHPSTSKDPPPVASSASEGAEASKDVDASGGVTGAGDTITAPPAVDTGAGDVRGEQYQQRLDGHAPRGANEGVTPLASPPPTSGHSRNNGARSGASHRPPTTPATGAVTAHVPPPGRADQTAMSNGAADPRAPPPRNPAAQVDVPQLRGRGTTVVTATGTIRSQATVRSTSSTSMPSTTTEAMGRAQLLLRFPPAAEQMDEWCATIQSLLGFA